MRWRIAAMCGASFGACAITVASTLPICQPAPLTRRAASESSASESAPRYCMSVSGKVMADVAERGGAEERVGDRVAERVGVGMAVRPCVCAISTPPRTSLRPSTRAWVSQPSPTRQSGAARPHAARACGEQRLGDREIARRA